MSRLTAYALLIAAIPWGVSATAGATEPLVDVAWARANLAKPGIVYLDVRSGAGVPKAGYLAGHVPGAVYTDYARDGWRERNAAGVEGMLPPAEKLERLIGGLGIDNAAHVVLIPEGRAAADVGTATRLYWTFKVLGHDNVSILDGGFQAWISAVDRDKKPVNPLETVDVKPTPKAFRANVRREMLIGVPEVQAAMAAKRPLIDNRPFDFFVGLVKSPAAKAGGTIPGAISIPEGWMTENGGGKFRSKAQLTQIYRTQGVPVTGEQITFCNTGHWASLGWFVSSELLGNKTVRMYDGSMAEWTQDPARPVERKIKLE